MPTGRRQHAVSVVDGKIYAIGGYTNFRQPGLSIVEVYDPVTDTWIKLPDMPNARAGSACTVNNKVYLIGGALTVKPPHPAVTTVEEYIP